MSIKILRKTTHPQSNSCNRGQCSLTTLKQDQADNDMTTCPSHFVAAVFYLFFVVVVVVVVVL